PAPASDRTGRAAAAAAPLTHEAAFGAQRPVAARPEEGADDDRVGVRLVQVESARLAQPLRPRLPEPRRDRDDGRARLAADDLELVPLADGRLVDVPRE